MRLRPLLLVTAGLCGLAAFAAEPQKAPETPSTPSLRMPFAPRPDQADRLRRELRIPPNQHFSVTTADKPVVGIPPGARPCSVPLVNVLPPVPPPSRMPTLTPAPNAFAAREAVLPAPPCPAGP